MEFGFSPSVLAGSMTDFLSMMLKMVAAAPRATPMASTYGAVCPTFMAPINTLKNTCTTQNNGLGFLLVLFALW